MTKNTMSVKVVLSSLFALFIIMINGCGSKVPEGYPNVTECVITVTEGGTPIKGVFIQVIPQPEVASLSVVGRTDDTGKAVMYTHLGTHSTPGVPLGNSVVILQKKREPEHFKTEEELKAMENDLAKLDAYQAELDARMAKLPPLVPPALTKKDATPIKIEAQAKQKIELTVNLDEYKK